MTYNPPLHPVHKEAKRLLKIAEDIKEQIKLSPDYGGDHIGPPKPIIFSSAFDPAPNEETILDEAIPDSPLLDIEPIAEDGKRSFLIFSCYDYHYQESITLLRKIYVTRNVSEIFFVTKIFFRLPKKHFLYQIITRYQEIYFYVTKKYFLRYQEIRNSN